MLSYHTLEVGQLQTNCYLVGDGDSGEGIIIDPGDDAEYVSDMLTKYGIRPVRVVATHGHFDHILAVFALTRMYGIPFAMHAEDGFLVRRMKETAKHFLGISYVDPEPEIMAAIGEGDTVSVGTSALRVLSVPGHTPGSICLLDEGSGTLISGDTIFEGGAVGRTDHSYGDRQQLNASLARILALPPNVRILPGHGAQTTVGAERRYHVQ